MTTIDTERLAHLVSLLPPAPAGWVEAAAELPSLRAGLDELIARADEDAILRERLIADLESAQAESGVAPTPPILAEARRRLGAR